VCPVCIATAVLVAGSATGSGGLTAFVARKILKRSTNSLTPIDTKEVEHGNRNDGRKAPQDRLAG